MTMAMKLMLRRRRHALVIVTTHRGAKQYLMNISKQYGKAVDILGVGTYPAVMMALCVHKMTKSVIDLM
jgi:hypothetical protein